MDSMFVFLLFSYKEKSLFYFNLKEKYRSASEIFLKAVFEEVTQTNIN